MPEDKKPEQESPKRKNRKKQIDNWLAPEESVDQILIRQMFMAEASKAQPQIIDSLFAHVWSVFMQLGELQSREGTVSKSVLKFDNSYDEWSAPSTMENMGREIVLRAAIYVEIKNWCDKWNLNARWCEQFGYQVLLIHWRETIGKSIIATLLQKRFPDQEKFESETKLESWVKATNAMNVSARRRLLSPKAMGVKKALREVLSKSLISDRLEQCLNEILPDIQRHFDGQKKDLKKQGWRKQEMPPRFEMLYTVLRRLPPLMPWDTLVEMVIQLHPDRYRKTGESLRVTKRKLKRKIQDDVDAVIKKLDFPRYPTFEKPGRKRQPPSIKREVS